jgi:hypothetical protein
MGKEDGILMYKGKIYMPTSGKLKKYIAEGNAQCAICWAPRISENNCSCKKPILLARNEERSS